MPVNLSQQPPIQRPRSGSFTQDLTNANSFPFQFIAPPNGRAVDIDDIIISGVNRQGNTRILMVLQYRDNNGNWNTIAGCGTNGIGIFGFNHAFAGQLMTGKGDGSTNVFRVILPEVTTTNFSISICIVGRLV